MNTIAGYLAGAWVVPEFCLALSGLLLGTGLGLLIKGWFHQRRKKSLMKLAGISKKPGAGTKAIPASMTMGKRLWNPSVFNFAGLLSCALAGVVFWPGLGRTDYLRIQEFSALVICLAGFLVSMTMVMVWAPAGLIPFLAYAALSLVLILTDPVSPGAAIYACHETPQTNLVPDPDENPLMSVEYLPGQPDADAEAAKAEGQGVWRISALSPLGKEILGYDYRSLEALVDQDLAMDFIYWEMPVFLRPFAPPLRLGLDLKGLSTGAANSLKGSSEMGLRHKTGNLEIKLAKVVSPREGTVIYLGGATRFMDLRLLPGQ